MNINELLSKGAEHKASDLHVTVARPPTMRINGKFTTIGNSPLSGEETELLMNQMLDERQRTALAGKGEIDFSYAIAGVGRFRVNAYRQRGSCAIAIRYVASKIPSIEELGLPMVIKDLAMKQRGMFLVTGPTGSGKSTTLAAAIDYINNNRAAHILTLEDPIEYLHKHEKSIVNQREIGLDSLSFSNALRGAMRQDPDVILVGEMRDFETISIALTAAETGHLVMSTLHTIGGAKTIDRIIDVFPPHQQSQVRVQLAGVLEGVISQQLVPKADGSGRAAAFEVMLCTHGIKNLIREGKIHQIQSLVQTGGKHGMRTMDASLFDLVRRGTISKEDALDRCVDRENTERTLL